MTCDRCGAQIQLGEWPFCPHGTSQYGVEAVTWPGGRVFENLGDQPVRCDSPADLKRELKARNLEECVRHMPLPGSDKSPHTTDWSRGCIDPQTLANAKALVERMGTCS